MLVPVVVWILLSARAYYRALMSVGGDDRACVLGRGQRAPSSHRGLRDRGIFAAVPGWR